MGIDWSSQCRAAVTRPLEEKRDALNSSYITLVAAFAVVAAAAAVMLVQHLRCGSEQWPKYAHFLVLTCCGCLFGKTKSPVDSTRPYCCATLVELTKSLYAGMTAWAANLECVNRSYDSDSEVFKNSSEPALLAQQQRLLVRYDTFAAVYQFTQVNPSESVPVVFFMSHCIVRVPYDALVL